MSTYTDPTVVSVGTAHKVLPGPLFAFIASLIMLLVAGVLLVQTYQAQNQKKAIQIEIINNTKKKDALKPIETQISQLALQNRNLTLLFDNQKRWDVVLGKIQERLYKNMAVTSFMLNADSTFSLTGTTPSYTDYAKIYQSLTDSDAQKTFSSAKPVSVTKQEAKEGQQAQVVFTFALTLNPTVLNLR